MRVISRRASLLGAMSAVLAATTASLATVARAGDPTLPRRRLDEGLSYPREIELLAWNLGLRSLGSAEPLARVERIIPLISPFDLLVLSGLASRPARAGLVRELCTSHSQLALARRAGGREPVGRVARADASGQFAPHEVASLARRRPAGGLLVASRHPIEEVAALGFDDEPACASKDDAALHLRLAIDASAGEYGRTQLDLFAVHLGADAPHSDRRACARRLARLGRFVAARASASTSALLVGTVACAEADYPRLRDDLPGFVDLWERAGPIERGATYDGTRNLLVDRPHRVARLDFTLFRPGPRAEAVSIDMPEFDRRWWTPPCEEARRRRRDGRFHLSAHFPLRSRVRVA